MQERVGHKDNLWLLVWHSSYSISVLWYVPHKAFKVIKYTKKHNVFIMLHVVVIPTTIAYCPVVNVFAALAGPWISRSFFISFLAFLRFGTLFRNFNLGFSGKTTSWERKTKMSDPQKMNTDKATKASHWVDTTKTRKKVTMVFESSPHFHLHCNNIKWMMS